MKKKIIAIVILLIITLGIGFGVYFIKSSKLSNEVLTDNFKIYMPARFKDITIMQEKYGWDADRIMAIDDNNVIILLETSSNRMTAKAYAEYTCASFNADPSGVGTTMEVFSGIPIVKVKYYEMRNDVEYINYECFIEAGNGQLLDVIGVFEKDKADANLKLLKKIICTAEFTGEPINFERSLENDNIKVTVPEEYYVSEFEGDVTIKYTMVEDYKLYIATLQINALEESVEEAAAKRAERTEETVKDATILGQQALIVSAEIKTGEIIMITDSYYTTINGCNYSLRITYPKGYDEEKNKLMGLLETIEFK